MYKFFVPFFWAFFLAGCTMADKVVRKNNDDVLGRVYITNGSGSAAIFLDDKFMGNTPLDIKLSVGEHHLIMKVYNNVVLDTVIDVTDDYNRNVNAGVAGSVVAGFVPLLLVPFPINIFVAPLSAWVVGENVTRCNRDKIARNPYKEYDVKSESLQKVVETKNMLHKGTDLAHYYKDSVAYVNGAVMHYVDAEKFQFLRQKRDDGDTLMVNAKYICYEESDDLVWAAESGSGTSVYRSDEFIPCEVDSLPHPRPLGDALMRGGIVTGAFGIVGAVAGGSLASTLGMTLAGWLLVGSPTMGISGHVFRQRNIHACQNFRSKPLVKKWYRQYPCRQNTKPIPESKNQ